MVRNTMKKKIKAYIEICDKKKDWYPTISLEKPFKREIKCGNEFGFKTYECEIIIKKEIK
jgi:hypothetical protein